MVLVNETFQFWLKIEENVKGLEEEEEEEEECKVSILTKNWRKCKGVSPCKFSILTKNWKENVKRLVHANFQFWLKIEENVKRLVLANFQFSLKSFNFD